MARGADGHGTQDAVQLCSEDGKVIGSGLVTYNSADMRKLMGVQSHKIEVRPRAPLCPPVLVPLSVWYVH